MVHIKKKKNLKKIFLQNKVTKGRVLIPLTQTSEQYVKRVGEKCKEVFSCVTLCHPMSPSRLLCPWGSPGKEFRSG